MLGVTATAVAAGYSLNKYLENNSEVTGPVSVVLDTDGDIQSAETVEKTEFFSEKFTSELEGYTAYFTIDKNHIQFVDTENKLVGEPILLESFVGPWPDGVRKPIGTEEPKYNYKIDEDEDTIPKITKRWRAVKQNEVQVDNPERAVDKYYHSHADLRAAVNESEEPALVQGVQDGSILSYKDIVDYFVQKEISGFPGNRIEYLQNFVEFRNKVETVKGVPGVEFVPVPPIVQTEFIRLLPGLIAQESKFNEGLVNKVSGASGPCQFTAETWKRYTGEEAVSQDFVRQVEVLGPCLSDMYDRVLDKIGEDSLSKLRGVFPDEESFLIDLIVPLTINSYNAGPDRVAEAVRMFVESVQLADMKPGMDLFLAIADFAEQSSGGEYLSGYSEHAREYTPRVYANAQVLGSQKEDEMQVARN